MSQYLEVKNLPWDKNPPENTFDYKSVKNAQSGENEAMIYHFTGDKNNLMSGKGVYELQIQLAYVFKHFLFDSIYKPYYIENEEYRKELTSGIYGPKTTEMIMQFQKFYMSDQFEGHWDPQKGFGSFGSYTKQKLNSLMLKVRRYNTRKRNEARARAATKNLST